ncbi:MAG: hypothetical protein AAFP02_16225 [Bacteroidota bacterium]
MWNKFVGIIGAVCLLFWSCQAPSENASNSLSLDDLYASALADDSPQTQLLKDMRQQVSVLQGELKQLDQKLEAAQSARSSHTGMMLNDSIYHLLLSEMQDLQGSMKPLCDKLPEVEVPLQLSAVLQDSADTEFGQPPLANQMILQQLSTDVQESERAILEAIVK